MSIKSVCNTNVITIQKGSSLVSVASLMQENHIGCVVIVENFNGKLIPAGIITDRDIALSVGSLQKFNEIKVEQIMQSHPVTVNENDGIYETTTKMKRYGVKRLPVVHTDGSLMGIISADDLLSLMGEEISNLSQIKETQVKNEQGIKIPVESHL